MAALAEEIIARHQAMKTEKSNWDNLNQEVRDLIFPSGNAFNVMEADGSKTHQKVYDGSGEYAAEDLAAWLHGTVTNPAIRWAGLRDEDDDINDMEDVGVYLDECNRRIFTKMYSARAKFVAAQSSMYLDLVPYGTGAKFILERPGDVPLHMGVPLSELCIDVSQDGDVDTVFRCFTRTARQAVQKWKDKVSPKIAEAAKESKKQDQKFTFLHCVYPRADADRPGTHGGRNMPFASIYLCIEDKAIIVESGMPEMGYIVPRWIVRGGEKYGRGCGHKALADVKMLNRSMRSQIRGQEKTVDPTLMIPDDGILSPVRDFAGGTIEIRSDLLTGRTDPLRYLTNPARLDWNEEFNEGVRKRIDRAFYGHLLRLQQDPRMTATQVLDIAEKTQSTIGPAIGRLETDDVGPTMARMYAIGQRSGWFPPPPPVLIGRDLKVEFLSPIARAQALTEVRGVSQTFDVLAPMLQVNPELADNFDQDKTVRLVASRLNFPRIAMRDPKLVAEMRKARTKTQDQQTAIATGHTVADAAGKAAPALKLLNGGGAPANDASAA